MAHHPPPDWQTAKGLVVGRFRLGPLWNFSYLVACELTGEATVIDPAWDVGAILEAAESRRLRITTAFLTHSHSDHANGLRELVSATGARAFIHVDDEPDLRAHADEAASFSSGEVFQLGDIAVRALGSPGHTPGSVCFLVGGRLFTGDSLAIASPGTPGPEPGSLETLRETTQRLKALPSETIVHPGHDSGPFPQSTLEAENPVNPALLAFSLDEFRRAIERSTGRSHH
jgi:glyoxylase-like metal-dependent hydrolase (beta-lactamase superfamily II)